MQARKLHRRRKWLRLSLAALVLAACGSNRTLVVDQLDPVTGVTVTRATTPLVLYRDTSARAAYARDYVNLGPIQVNRMGQFRYFLWLGVWSTMQGWESSRSRDAFETITVFADGEPLQLELQGWSIAAIGATEPVYLKPVASSIDAYYEATFDQIRLIAEASEIRLHTGPTQPLTYEPWDDQDSALSSMRAFIRSTAF